MSGPNSYLARLGNFLFRKQFSFTYPWAGNQWTNTFENYVEQGYAKNSVGYFAVDKISTKCAEIPMRLWQKTGKKETEITVHPVLDLLKRPGNLTPTYQDLINAWVSFLKIDGNSYILSPDIDLARGKVPQSLIIVQPNMIQATRDSFGAPISYDVTLGQERLTIPILIGDFNPISHTKTFNPLDRAQGFSPFSALRYSVQLLNETNLYAVNFVKNRCTPPSLLTV